MTDATRALIREVREALGKATKGPWETTGCSHGGRILLRGSGAVARQDWHPQTHLQVVPTEDAELIAHAPSWLAALCEALEKMDAPEPARPELGHGKADSPTKEQMEAWTQDPSFVQQL